MGVVLLEQVPAKIALIIAPYRVNVVGIVLAIVKFDHKCFSLYAVVVCFAKGRAPCPYKPHFLHFFFTDVAYFPHGLFVFLDHTGHG